ncbi:MAG TPA: hypothetical protein VHU89_02290 [Acidobacteriaceae bacterium]|jgi:hypothetical protein|nr:hypothetical protein [Acidobacteriaceae bacterium]
MILANWLVACASWLAQLSFQASAGADASLSRATWDLVWVTGFLVTVTFAGLFWSIWDSKSKMAIDRERERNRERQYLLDGCVSRFNSAPLLIVRAELAKQNLGPEQSSLSGIDRVPAAPGFRLTSEVPPQAFVIMDFLAGLANHWKAGSLDIDALDSLFSDYILIFCHEYEDALQRKDVAEKYEALNHLVTLLNRLHEHASITPGVDILSAGWPEARRHFWYSEYKLFRMFPGELPPLPAEAKAGR